METLSGPGPFTVFAPPDDAFDDHPTGLVDTLFDDPEGQLTESLQYPVVSGGTWPSM